MAYKITRKQFLEIYQTKGICVDWKNEIEQIMDKYLGKWQDEVELPLEVVKKGFTAAISNNKTAVITILEEVFPDYVNNDPLRKIKTWRDVLNAAGKEELEILPFKNPINKAQISINAVAKIQLISQVFNEDWIEDFNNSNQYKWFPWFQKAPGVWVFYRSYCYGSCSSLGFGFYFKSEEVSNYVGRQFIDIYKEYLPS